MYARQLNLEVLLMAFNRLLHPVFGSAGGDVAMLMCRSGKSLVTACDISFFIYHYEIRHRSCGWAKPRARGFGFRSNLLRCESGIKCASFDVH